MQLKWHGHSCITIESENSIIIVDPFITGNQMSDLDVDTLKVDYILLTHAHGDHVGDTVALAKNNNAKVVAIVELADYLEESYGVDVLRFNMGGTLHLDFGSVKLVPAFHSSSYNGIACGEAGGLIINVDSKRIYHAGDTALFTDMSLHKNIDYCFLPIGDTYTMGIEDAILAANLIDSQFFIPIHYNTFPEIQQSPERFVSGLKPLKGLIPEVGEGIITK